MKSLVTIPLTVAKIEKHFSNLISGRDKNLKMSLDLSSGEWYGQRTFHTPILHNFRFSTSNIIMSSLKFSASLREFEIFSSAILQTVAVTFTEKAFRIFTLFNIVAENKAIHLMY